MKKLLMALLSMFVVGAVLVAPSASAGQSMSDRPDVTQICHGGATLEGWWDGNTFVTEEIQADDKKDRSVVHGEWKNGKKAHEDDPAVPGYFKTAKGHDGDYLGPCVVPPAPPAPGVAPAPGPEPIHQAYGVPADWVCDPLFTPEGAGWPGTPVGGWGKSWAKWPNEGTGGFVCQRSIVAKGNIWVLVK